MTRANTVGAGLDLSTPSSVTAKVFAHLVLPLFHFKSDSVLDKRERERDGKDSTMMRQGIIIVSLLVLLACFISTVSAGDKISKVSLEGKRLLIL